MMLKQQKPDAFTVSPAELNDHIMRVRKVFEAYTTQLQNASQREQPIPQALPQPIQIKNEAVAPSTHADAVPSVELSPGLIQRKPSLQRKTGTKPPAAPTSAQAPYSFRTPPPHGTPVYAPTDIPITLNLPANKKRKVQDTTKPSTPQATASMNASQQSLTPSARAAASQAVEQQLPAAPDLPFKCPIPDCDFEITGFQTPDERDQHASGVHGYKDDALEFCLAQMRKMLCLDEQGHASEKTKTVAIKKELKPTPSAFSKLATSPPAELFSTPKPQPPATTAIAADGASKKPTPDTKPPSTPDAWTASAMSPSTLLAVFANLVEDPLASLEPSPTNPRGPSLPSPPLSTPGHTPDSDKDSHPSEKSLSFDLLAWDPFPQYSHGGVDGGMDVDADAEAIAIKVEGAPTEEAAPGGDAKRVKLTPPAAPGKQQQHEQPVLGPRSGLDDDEDEVGEAFARYWDEVNVADENAWFDYGA